MIQEKYFNFNRRGFGSVVSTLIMFIAVVGVSLALVMSFQKYVSSTQDAMDVQNSITANKLKSSVSIANIYYNSSSTKLYVYVKNIGTINLIPNEFDLYVDGRYKSNFSKVYADNLTKPITLLVPQETMGIIYTSPLSAGTHTVKVVSGYSSRDEDSFNI